ncbi:MAG: hypothetical protein NTU41_07785 [Chloroflexi bacterium]|nr:hypothetical protein [Chloroflexota bacterium]
MEHKAKAHIVLPLDLLENIDAMVGRRKRSKFIAEAAREKMAREKFLMAVEKAAGAWTDENHPDLLSDEDVRTYISESRDSYRERTTGSHQ